MDFNPEFVGGCQAEYIRIPLAKFEHELTADTAVGSGDEGDLVGDVHGLLAS
ncbi:hypothetical protein ACWDFR_44970 [Streptomyces sp. 900105755]